MGDEIITVWISKYALTQGIFKKRGSIKGDLNLFDSGESCMMYYRPNEYHRTWEEACARAEVMRQKKLASLRKQIAKLEGLVFEEDA